MVKRITYEIIKAFLSNLFYSRLFFGFGQLPSSANRRFLLTANGAFNWIEKMKVSRAVGLKKTCQTGSICQERCLHRELGTK
jgi:hypothetical protein